MARSQFPVARPRKTAAAKKTKPLKRLQTHVFQNGGRLDWDGEGICEGCDFRRDHRVHDQYQLIDEAIELDERKGG